MILESTVNFEVKFVKDRFSNNIKFAKFFANVIINFQGKKDPHLIDLFKVESNFKSNLNLNLEKIKFLNHVSDMIILKEHEKIVKEFLIKEAKKLFKASENSDEYNNLLSNIQEKLLSENMVFNIEEKDGEIQCKSM